MKFPLVRVTGKSGRFAPGCEYFPPRYFPYSVVRRSWSGGRFQVEWVTRFAGSAVVTTTRKRGDRSGEAPSRQRSDRATPYQQVSQQQPLFLIASRLNGTCLVSWPASWCNLGRDSIPKLSTRFHALSTSTESWPPGRWRSRGWPPGISASRAYHEYDRKHVGRDGGCRVAGEKERGWRARDCTTRARSFSRVWRPFSKGQKFIHRRRAIRFAAVVPRSGSSLR